MSHSYANTMLARLGFQDTDRKDKTHDRLCYDVLKAPREYCYMLEPEALIRTPTVKLEVPIQKGEGKYATTVGFADIILDYQKAIEQLPCVRIDDNYNSIWVTTYGPSRLEWVWKEWLIEVKTKIDNVGDVLRQMNLYREYARSCSLAILLPEIDVETRSVLESQGIRVLVETEFT